MINKLTQPTGDGSTTYGDVIPFSTAASLDRYVNHGIRPGSFLLAVLHNNLVGACINADPQNAAALRYIVMFMYHEAPSSCWGSPATVDAWVESKIHEEAR